MWKFLGVVAVLAAAGCKKDKPPSQAQVASAQVSTAEQDALWKLAPDGTSIGFVASSRALASIEGGWLAMKDLFATAPDLAPLGARLDAVLEKAFGSSNVKLADVGLAPSQGGAVFQRADGGQVVIVPVANRDKFLAFTKGTKGTDSDIVDDHTCKTVQGVYACANPAALLDTLGKGTTSNRISLAGARGDVEVTGTLPAAPGAPVNFAVVAQLERGAITLRGGVQGAPPSITTKIKSAGKPPIDPDKAAGFVVLNLAPFLAEVALPPLEIAPGVTLAQLAATVRDPQTISIAPGAFMADVRVPLADVTLVRQILDQCESLPPLKALGAKRVDVACRVPVPQLQLEVDAWLEGNALRIGKKGVASTKTVPPAPIARELLGGDWAFAMYGRGTVLGEMPSALPLAMMEIPDEARHVLRALMFVNEVAYAARVDGDTVRVLIRFRTAFSNPADVITKLAAIPPLDAWQGKAVATGKQIAAASPQSPFAADVEAGAGGMMIPIAAVGMLAAVAIPALMDYMKTSKRTEGDLQLRALGKAVQLIAIDTGALPKGEAPLTPSKSCCDYPRARCDDPQAWQHPVWQTLDFAMENPHLFRYSYESDGKTFTAKAVTDLDCDGIEVTYVLTGAIDAQGVVTQSLTPPPPNTD